MALSLEVKKFINSEHVGKFVEIHLPLEGEPVRPPKKNKKAPAEPQPEDVEKTQPEPLPPQEEEDPAFETLRIHYMDEGDGEPLVLVHTIGQSIYTWRCLYASLTQHYRVIAVDMPGFGYSSRPDVYSYTIEEQSKALELFHRYRIRPLYGLFHGLRLCDGPVPAPAGTGWTGHPFGPRRPYAGNAYPCEAAG